MKQSLRYQKACLGLTLIVMTQCLHYSAWAQGSGGKANPETSTNQPRLVVQLGHSAYSAAFSPDGSFVVTGGYDHTARLWETATGREIRHFEGHTGGVFAVAFSPDSRFLLTGSSDKTARLWEVASGQEIRRFEGHSGQVSAVAFSPDGRFLATAGINTDKDKPDTIIRLWDTATGQEVRRFTEHTSNVTSTAFSPDGRFLLTGSWDHTARLWEVATGREIQRFIHPTGVKSVAFSPDGSLVLTGTSSSLDGSARLWEVVTGREIQRFAGHTVAFSPDGQLALTLSGGATSFGFFGLAARFWDISTGQEVRQLEGYAASQVGSNITAAAFSPDGRQALTLSYMVRLWDVAKGQEIRRLEGFSSEVRSVTFSPDGFKALTADTDGTAHLWDMTTGQEVRRFQGAGSIETAIFSPDGRFMLTGGEDFAPPRLFDITNGQEVLRFGQEEDVDLVAFSPDGRLVATVGKNDARLWEVATGEELHQIAPGSSVKSLAFSPDGRFVSTIASGEKVKVQLWNVATGQQARSFEVEFFGKWGGLSRGIVTFSPDGRFVLAGGYSGGLGSTVLLDVNAGQEVWRFAGSVKSLAFSPDGRYVLTGGRETAELVEVKNGTAVFRVTGGKETAELWEVASGKAIRRFEHEDSVTSVTFSPDGHFVLTGSEDKTARLWDTITGQELCRMISFRDGSWAIVDPQGRYDASNGGDIQGLHWVVGNESIALSQLKERYYTPRLLAKILGLDKEPLPTVEGLKSVHLFPQVEYEAPAPDSTQLKVTLTNRGGGIGRVQVLVNGKEVAADARGPSPDPQAASAELSVDLAGAPLKPGESNTIQVIAWNAEGYLSSRGVEVLWTPPGSPATQAPELYAIVGGISEYASPALRLSFAAKDAEDMARALELGAQRLFGVEKVHVTLLHTSNDPQALAPTKANFRKAFEELRKAKPGDILVVYLAGHGVALPGERDLYGYLTQEARSTDLSDPAVRARVAVTSDELVEWLKQIPALKQVMVLDTCAAGAFATKLVEQRAVPADQIRAIERMKDRTGFHILMGSAADKVSYEATQYGQGLLTYALLQGMRGAALREGEYVDVSTLFQYATDQVPQLARHIGGIQKPLIAAPRGDSFDVGRLTIDDKLAIPLAAVKPLLLRPVLLDPEQGFDHLELMAAVRQRLLGESSGTTRGSAREQAAVYVDTDELPGALRPSGTYSVDGQTVQVNLFLIRDGQRIANFQIEGTVDDPAGLAAKIVEGLAQGISRLPQ